MAGSDDPGTTPDPDPDTPPAPGATRDGRSAGLVLAVSLALVFAVLAAVLAVLLAGGSDDDGESAEVRQAAGRFAEALVTYDHRDPEAHRDAVLALATGSFRDEYEDAFEQGLSQIITEVEAVSRGFVKDVFVSEIDEERASAVVVVDVEHDGTAGPRTLYDIYFRLTFVKAGEAWKVDQVIDLNFGAGPQGSPQAPGVTTDTTVPTTTSVP